jgi:hypothetical protein
MTIQELKTLLSNKISSLNIARSTAASNGDIEAILRLNDEIFETQATLNTLNAVG